ncbi:VCBS domain-containing protein, partial [Bradyrhizobium sp. WSM1743]|uniref:VCBS domain-containing protein n=1 Tax=Bradyrhizobium sp. WSM1743 TaxID=318996 RepID=UPI000487A539
MATQTTGGGSTVSFGTTPQANTDIYSFTEDASNILILNVLANDLGGAAKTLFSLDDGTSTSASTKSYAPADLLVKDVAYSSDAAGAAGTSDHSALGARIWIESDGTVHYDKGDINAQLQALAVGETLTDTFTYAIQLGNGTLSWATVTLQFNGLNDTPTIVVNSTTANGSFIEAANTAGSTTPDSATGTITFADADLHDTHSVSNSGPSFSWSAGSLTSAQVSALAAASSLNLVTTDSTNSGTGTVKWTYSAADETFDFLALGQTLTVTYTVAIDDGHGGTVSQPVTVTVTGTNDQPIIVAGSTTASGTFSETANTTGSSAAHTASGSIGFADVDISDTHTSSVTGVTTGGTTSGLPPTSTLLSWFSLGAQTDSINGATGTQAWSFSAQDKGFDYLAAGESVTLIYSVQISDGHGGTVTQPVTITVTGTNDAAILSADTRNLTETNSATDISTSGTLTISDVDSPATFVAQAGTAGSYGTFAIGTDG